MTSRRVCVRNGLQRVLSLIEEYKKMLYRYNALIRDRGFYLKPIHIVVKNRGAYRATYYYIGRYWWRIEYAGKRGSTSRIRWRYLGREKPAELRGYPDPPRNPLEGLRFYAIGSDIVVDEIIYSKYRWVFEGLDVDQGECIEDDSS